jgi:hypothetical protein
VSQVSIESRPGQPQICVIADITSIVVRVTPEQARK